MSTLARATPWVGGEKKSLENVTFFFLTVEIVRSAEDGGMNEYSNRKISSSQPCRVVDHGATNSRGYIHTSSERAGLRSNSHLRAIEAVLSVLNSMLQSVMRRGLDESPMPMVSNG